MESVLSVGVGDIHGRFHRVLEWLDALEQGLGRAVDWVLAVGDVEAFASADDHRRKAAKRTLPAEFAEYAAGTRHLNRPFHFVGGNNEDFERLHSVPTGAELPGRLRYLGRVGEVTLSGLRVAYLSGIYAPKHFDRPLSAPTSVATRKEAGYFRRAEVQALESLPAHPALLVVHEWPKGLVTRGGARRYRAQRFPWIGNAPVRACVEQLQPQWVWCGHSHVPWAQTLGHRGGGVTRVACLDQAANPEGALFWVEWRGGAAARAGWGTSGQVAWAAGDPWGPDRLPDVSLEPAAPEP